MIVRRMPRWIILAILLLIVLGRSPRFIVSATAISQRSRWPQRQPSAVTMAGAQTQPCALYHAIVL